MLLALDLSLHSWGMKTSECPGEGCSEASRFLCLPTFTSQVPLNLQHSQGCRGIDFLWRSFYFYTSLCIQAELLLTLERCCLFCLCSSTGGRLWVGQAPGYKGMILFTQSELMTLLALRAFNSLIITSKQWAISSCITHAAMWWKPRKFAANQPY